MKNILIAGAVLFTLSKCGCGDEENTTASVQMVKAVQETQPTSEGEEDVVLPEPDTIPEDADEASLQGETKGQKEKIQSVISRDVIVGGTAGFVGGVALTMLAMNDKVKNAFTAMCDKIKRPFRKTQGDESQENPGSGEAS